MSKVTPHMGLIWTLSISVLVVKLEAQYSQHWTLQCFKKCKAQNTRFLFNCHTNTATDAAQKMSEMQCPIKQTVNDKLNKACAGK